MTKVRQLSLSAVAGVLLAFSLAGCGKSGNAPVSGVVTLNGKPHRNALVSFLPIANADHPNPGRASSGFTDENGHFTLKAVDGDAGAVVGKHRVRIATKYNDKVKGYEVWDSDLNKLVKAATDPIPPGWGQDSKKEFDVPSGGTDKANFDIVTKK
jgi:hypothetical protein